MIFPFLSSSAEMTAPSLMYLQILFFGAACWYTGRSVGNIVDIQYREPEGQPKFVRIPEQNKWMFYFRYSTGIKVVKEGLISHILGYFFFALELCVFVLASISGEKNTYARAAYWMFFLFVGVLGIGVLLPMGIRYERNMQTAFDCDWITHLQEALTVLPKRRCTVISEVNAATYEIRLGRWGRKKRLARTSVPVTVGSKMYAVHSNEHGSPFWTIRDH